MKESDKCRYSERLPAFRTCNTHQCEEEESSEERSEEVVVKRKRPDEPKVELVQNDSLTGKKSSIEL